MSVTCGVVALLLAGGFIEWIYWAMREETIGSRLGHVQIVRTGYRETGTSDPFRFLIAEESSEREAVEKTAGVLAIAPRLVFSGLISAGDATLSFIGEGIDADKEQAFARGFVITHGEDLAVEDTRGVIVGQGLAANLGAKVGDTVVLLANTQARGINGVEVRVRGLFATVSKAFDDAAVRVPRAMASELLRVRGAQTWVLFLDSTARTDEVVKELRRRLAGRSMDVTPWHELADFYNKTKELFSKQVAVMRAIIAAIIILSISNTLTMSILERTNEIGTSMALGAKRRDIMAQYITEGLIIGIVGGLAGLALGLVLARVISAIGIPMPPPPGMARGFVGEIRVTLPLAAEAFALAVVTTFCASLYPARQASRLSIVDSLRHNR